MGCGRRQRAVRRAQDPTVPVHVLSVAAWHLRSSTDGAHSESAVGEEERLGADRRQARELSINSTSVSRLVPAFYHAGPTLLPILGVVLEYRATVKPLVHEHDASSSAHRSSVASGRSTALVCTFALKVSATRLRSDATRAYRPCPLDSVTGSHIRTFACVEGSLKWRSPRGSRAPFLLIQMGRRAKAKGVVGGTARRHAPHLDLARPSSPPRTDSSASSHPGRAHRCLSSTRELVVQRREGTYVYHEESGG
ncbi:uncharacterized protein PSFLO_02998 [Pseudozyma flocculosa]|uniref:Uncharacterized protein n=1 Tax=Pseudozyma flocculosa TaxID=84751 RepID=A0A5C3EZ17_9BASI|nr:uncharacterized protein PSFLO_02998 [Pseudozyma flocculosa]